MKNILITGASSGIGAATARLLNAKGFRLGLMARSTDKLNALAAELGDRCLVLTCDVTRYEEVQASIQKFMDAYGNIDVLINNAGLGYFDTLVGGKIEEWHTMVDVNVKGVLNCIHVALPALIEARGHVINLGSLASHQVFPNSGVYCATKHALIAISDSLRLELPDKLRVTTISPGSVDTPFINSTSNAQMLEQYKDYFAAGLKPEMIADQILHAIESSAGGVISEIIIRPNRTMK
jgi:NADP-dependent 3-hydroxy acid dehydrogenase YdfG